MILIFRNFIFSAAVGFMLPTLAFATIEDAPSSPTTSRYLFELSYEDAEGAIGFGLADKGAGAKVGATITGRKPGAALFSYDKPIAVEIRSLTYDNATGKWNANLLILSDKEVISAMPLAGRYEELMEIPVLKRQVRSGDMIKAEDVELRDYPLSRTRSDTIGDLASLIGKSPLRTISSGRPIREDEIAQPIVVKKNNIVQIRYESPSVQISTSGQATEDGSIGSVISVRNLTSKKLVRAVVENEKTVSIVIPGAESAGVTSGGSHATN